MKGILFIISSPSGGGKGTLIRAILSSVPNVGYSVSYTTRSPREGEQNGREYFFVSVEEFTEMRERGEFLESATVHNNFYGTSQAEVERQLTIGRDIILEIDVQGAELVRRRIPDAVGIFIMPPSFAVLRERLERRGSERAEDVSLRLANASGELHRYHEFDYFVLNDDLERATNTLRSIIAAEHARVARNHVQANTILQTFNNAAAGGF